MYIKHTLLPDSGYKSENKPHSSVVSLVRVAGGGGELEQMLVQSFMSS